MARYGSQSKVAAAFGVTRAAVQRWVREGVLPAARQWQYKAGLVEPRKRS